MVPGTLPSQLEILSMGQTYFGTQLEQRLTWQLPSPYDTGVHQYHHHVTLKDGVAQIVVTNRKLFVQVNMLRDQHYDRDSYCCCYKPYSR